MSEEREELAGIARSLRRALEREQAEGTAELLASGARSATDRVRRRRSVTPAVTEAIAGERPSIAAPELPGRATSVRRESGAAADASRAPAPGPITPAASRASAPTSARTNLFGEPEPVAQPAAATTATFDLPPIHPPLNPIEVSERLAVDAAALPILEEIAGTVRSCRLCGLCDGRTQAVPGVGSARSGIVFVGEAPGAEEDRRGEPFVGRAGELLTRIIKAMDDARLIPDVSLTRESVYICNVLKCRPPENRNPLPHEVELCAPYLRKQLEALRPRVICCLGKFAAELLVGVKGTIAGLRGRIYRYEGAKLIVTYHPAACLRNPNLKRPVWEDMQLLAREYSSE